MEYDKMLAGFMESEYSDIFTVKPADEDQESSDDPFDAMLEDFLSADNCQPDSQDEEEPASMETPEENSPETLPKRIELPEVTYEVASEPSSDLETKMPITVLEKDGTADIIVTSDGKTLADMLPHLRGGTKSLATRMLEKENLLNVTDVDGQLRTDARFLSHRERINETVESDKKKIALGKKFIQRNSSYTEEEKVIMKNLGITNSHFTALMGSKALTEKQKAWMVAQAQGGEEKHFKGKRYRTTIGDKDIIEFLAKFKMANSRILRWLNYDPQGRCYGKLTRLRANGVIANITIIGMPDMWCLTEAGMALSGYDFKTTRKHMPKYSTIPPILGVNYIAACLWNNSVNVLALPDFPAVNRKIANQGTFDTVRGELLVSELEIRRSLGKEIDPRSSSLYSGQKGELYKYISQKVETMWREWENGPKNTESPEFSIGNELMWILFPQQEITVEFHVPDLVVKRDRGPNGEPNSIAVEIELTEKKTDNYRKTMLAYKLDKRAYSKVIWVTPSNRIARLLTEAAAACNFTRYDIVPIITDTGTYNKHDIWLI